MNRNCDGAVAIWRKYIKMNVRERMKYMRMKIRDENDSLNNQKIICLIDNSLFFFAFQIICRNVEIRYEK